MKTLFNWLLSAFIFLTVAVGSSSCGGDEPLPPPPPPAETPQVVAFPGAEGAGAYAVGGRGCPVVYVTNLNDAGEGSLRAAVTNFGSGITVLFAVSGTIELESSLHIVNNNITIAGQSAPGDGITLANYTTYIKGDNIIIQFIRFRLGDRKPFQSDTEDTVEGQNNRNIMIDHCSMSWSLDEGASFYDNDNMTMQWCVISESLRLSKHPKGGHGYGGMWGGRNVTFHHNLFAHHDSRNPRFCGARFSAKPDEEKVDFRNNVIYNWGGNSGYGGEGGVYNMVNNYYKPGPATNSNVKSRIFAPDSDPSNGGDSSPLSQLLGGVNKPCWGKFYVAGNYMDGKGNNWDWNGIEPQPRTARDGSLTAAQAKEMIKLTSEVQMTNAPIRTQTAQEAYNSVLGCAGASYVRDVVDNRIINNVTAGNYTSKTIEISTGYYDRNGVEQHSRNGLIDSQVEVGGFPELNKVTLNLNEYDTDKDGIPNVWEMAYGLNPNDASDGRTKTLDPNGNYTNLEIYLHDLVKDKYPQ